MKTTVYPKGGRGLVTQIPFGWRTRTFNVHPETTGTESGDNLQADCFWNLVQGHPVRKEIIEPAQAANARLLDHMTSESGFEKSRRLTVNNTTIAMSTATVMTQYLLTDPQVQEAMRKQAQAQQLSEMAERREKEAEQAERDGRERDAKILRNDAKSRRGDSLRAAQEAADQIDKTFDGMGGQAKLRAAGKKAEKAAEDADTFLSSWGNEQANLETADPSLVVEMMNRLSQNGMAEIARAIGRVKSIARQVNGEANSKIVSLTDVNPTKKFPRMFPTERSKLSPQAPAVSRFRAIRDLTGRGGLLGITDRTEENIEGDVIFRLDRSGSMREGNRWTLGAGLAVGLCKFAGENGQGWSIATFGMDVSRPVFQDDDPMKLIELISVSPGGGTNFDAAINSALDDAERAPDGVDICMITDGDCSITAETAQRFIERREIHKTRLILLVVETGETYPEVEALADYVISIPNAKRLDEAAETLARAIYEKGGIS